MNIKDLTMSEIGEKIRKYLPPTIREAFEFEESYQLHFDEISRNIPHEYHEYFKDNAVINSASGSVEKADYDYIVILVSSEDYSTAILLLLQKIDNQTGETETEIIKNFIESEGN